MVTIIVVYMDDLPVASATKRDEEQSLNYLHSCFPIKDLGEASYYLGCPFLRDQDTGTLELDHHQYVQALAEHFRITKTSAIPSAARGKPLSKADGPQTHANLVQSDSFVALAQPIRRCCAVLGGDALASLRPLSNLCVVIFPIQTDLRRRAVLDDKGLQLSYSSLQFFPSPS